MPYNNPTIYNAAVSGIAGGVEQRWVATVDPNLANRIAAVATAIDAQIAPIGGGATDAQAELMSELCMGVFSSRYLGNEPVSAYTQIIAAIVNAFNAIGAKLTYVAPGPPPVLAPSILYSAFTFSTTSPAVLYTSAPNVILYSFSILMTTPFNDPSASCQLGITGDLTRIFNTNQVGLNTSDQFDSDQRIIQLPSTNLILTLAPGASTQGSGVVMWSVSPL